MKICSFLVPLLSIAAGVAGFFLRRYELTYIFDPLTGLPERNALVSNVLIGLSLSIFVLITVFAVIVTKKKKANGGFDNTFGTNPLVYTVLFVIISVVWVAGTVVYFIDLRNTGLLGRVDLIYLGLSGFAAVSAAFFAVEMFQDSRRKKLYALSLVPAIFLSFWLVVFYMGNATNPIVLQYVYKCLAIIFSALAFYYTSGFIYNKPAPARAIVSYFSSIFFSLVTLADNMQIGQKIILVAIICASLIHMSVVIRYMQTKDIRAHESDLPIY